MWICHDRYLEEVDSVMKDVIMGDRLLIGEAVDKEDKSVDLLSMNQWMMMMTQVNTILRVGSSAGHGPETIKCFEKYILYG